MKIKVTAIGEILFDVYSDYKKLGGAPFNFIYHLWKFTGYGNIVSRIGADEDGDRIIRFLKERNFKTTFIQIDDKHSTGAVNVTLDENKIPQFNILENRAYDYINVNDEILELSESSDLLYFGSLAQRNEVSRKSIHSLAEKAPKVLCDLNIRQNYYSEKLIEESLQKSNVVKLNSDELELVNNLLIKKNFEIKTTARTLFEKYNLDLLCITLGSDGAYLFDRENLSHHKTKVNNIVDTVGAGDAFAAMMSIGYLKNWNIEKTNKLASEFSAEICKVNGAIPGDEKLYNNYIEKIKNE